MRSKLTLLMMLVFVVSLSACSSGTESKVFAMEEPGVVGEITITYIEDDIISQKTRTETEYSALGVSNKKEAEELYTALNEPNIELKDVTIKTQYKKDKVIMETDILVEELDLAELEENESLSLTIHLFSIVILRTIHSALKML